MFSRSFQQGLPFSIFAESNLIETVKINHVMLPGIFWTSSNLKGHIKNFRQTTIVNFSNPFFKYLNQRQLLQSIESKWVPNLFLDWTWSRSWLFHILFKGQFILELVCLEYLYHVIRLNNTILRMFDDFTGQPGQASAELNNPQCDRSTVSWYLHT